MSRRSLLLVAWLVFAAGGAPVAPARTAADAPKRHFLVILRTGPAFDEGRPPQELPGFAKHAAYQEEQAKQGAVVLGGPLLTPEGTKLEGAMLIVAATGSDEARRVAEADPFCQAGVLAVSEVRGFFPASGAWKPREAGA